MTSEDKVKQMTDRNNAICTYYTDGHTLKETASFFQLHRQRVLQILQTAGVWRPYVRGSRTQFLGISVTEETKNGLRRRADEQGISVSRLASNALEEVVK